MRLNDDYIYSDTLIHGGKYIDKYRSKKTGKWIYVYTKAGYTRPEKDRKTGKSYNVKVPETKVYQRDSNKLFSSTTVKTNNHGDRSEYREIGKVDRALKNASKGISKGVDKAGQVTSKNYHSFVKKSSKQISKARKWVKSLF